MLVTLRRRLLEAFEAHAGSDDVPGDSIKSLDAESIHLIVAEYVNVFYRRLTSAEVDPRQQWLDLGLPQYSHIIVQKGESLDEYRARTEKLDRRIRSYGYARRSSEKLKRDKKELRERKILDAKLAPFFAGDAMITIDQAIELYRRDLEKPARKKQTRAIKARWARTKNQ